MINNSAFAKLQAPGTLGAKENHECLESELSGEPLM